MQDTMEAMMNESPELPNLVSVEKAAEVLNLSVGIVYRLWKEGKIPGTKRLGKLKIDIDGAVARILEDLKKKPEGGES